MIKSIKFIESYRVNSDYVGQSYPVTLIYGYYTNYYAVTLSDKLRWKYKLHLGD